MLADDDDIRVADRVPVGVVNLLPPTGYGSRGGDLRQGVASDHHIIDGRPCLRGQRGRGCRGGGRRWRGVLRVCGSSVFG